MNNVWTIRRVSWCLSWSNSLWQGWSYGLVHCPGGNATDLIWWVLASSDGISSWIPLKPQHSNPNPNPLVNQLWFIVFTYSSHTTDHPSQTPCLPWIPYATQKLMLDSCKMLQRQSEALHTFVSPRPDCIFEICQLWQSVFSRVYSNCCCSCSFEAEIIKIDQSSQKIYSNNIKSKSMVI